MEVDSVVGDNINEDQNEHQSSEHSCSQTRQSTIRQQTDNMATTAAPGPLSVFQEPRGSIAASRSPALQFYDSAELSFANNKQKKVRINKRRVAHYNHQPPSSPPAATTAQAVQRDDAATTRRFSAAQVAPIRRSAGFGSRTGSTDSLPGLTSGMVVCPHLHQLEPEVGSGVQFYAIDEAEEPERDVAVHKLDTRRMDSVGDDVVTTTMRLSTSPPPLQMRAPRMDDSVVAEEDPQAQVFAGEDYRAVQDTGAPMKTRPLHRPLTRQGQRGSLSQSVHDQVMKDTAATEPVAASSSSLDAANLGKLLLISPEHDAPIPIGKTRPVPPPKVPLSEIKERESLSTSPPQEEGEWSYSPRHDDRQSSSPKHRRRNHHSKILQSTVSSPAMFGDRTSPPHHRRMMSFRECKAGEEVGQFRADYLGSKEVDGYISVINTIAKQVVDQRSADVIVYVSSQKIRLAPPQNEAVLFKSFAVKDILMVEKCTINRRIIGIIVWKSKTQTPTCHVLRCSDEIVSKALYEAVRDQTQIYDDITLNKTYTPTPSNSPTESPSHSNHLHLSNMVDSSPGSSSMSSSGVESSSSSNGSMNNSYNSSYRDVPGFSATQILHKFCATYVGKSVAGKLHSIDDVIQKVLTDSRPTAAKDLFVCLSLAEVKYVEERGEEEEEEVVCMAHETSRIRAIGVCSQDKRFMGYIIKEEGKPLTTYVLRCNSAALMVSLTSFLRQSCQLTSFQRGGSFYDELSADDGDDCDYIIDGPIGLCDSLGIVRRLRSLTNTLSQRTLIGVPSATRPTFQSHTQLHKKLSPTNDIPQRRRDSVTSPTLVSPFDFTDEDYAKFHVTYVGSATLNPPLTQQSVVEAMNVFSERGTAAGQAAVVKNSVCMQVSALGINLSDKKRKLFIYRNYPRKQLEGYCAHPTDADYFAFASRRPGYSSLKVHVFKRGGSEPVEQILDAVQFWLEIDPVTS